MKRTSLYPAFLLLLAAATPAATVTWDGGGVGNAWTTAANWDTDTVPVAGDNVIVIAGATVTNAQNAFATLDIQAGASVTLAVWPNGSNTITCAGVLDYPGVLRLGGATINMSATGSFGPSITFFDTNNGTINLADGASFANASMHFEHKGTNTFGYTLSATGFNPTVANHLFRGSGALWSQATYNIDVSAYNIANGKRITLADYTGSSMLNDFNPTTNNPVVNIIAGGSGLDGILFFDTTTFSLDLILGPVIWDGGGADNSWQTAANWDTDVVPYPGAEVIVTTGAAVSNGQSDFGHLTVQAGASVTFTENTNSLNTIDCAGSINLAGVWRLQGATINFSSTGSFGPNITFLDTNNATINFVDGASFANTNMPFEHKGTNTFGYTLSATGFATLDAGGLFRGSGALWSQTTYNIDISAYNVANGRRLTLADYSSSAMPATFDPTINIIGGTGTLVFDPVANDLVLTIGNPEVTWDGDAGNNLWTTPSNWDTDTLPLTIDHVVVGGAAAVTAGLDDFAMLDIQAGASVTLAQWPNGSNTINADGAFNYSGVLRLQGATINLGATGSFGPSITFLDTNNGTISFADGASFANSGMPFEHKGTNVFNYTLSPTGFSTMNAGSLFRGSAALWSQATYNIDISNLTVSTPTTVITLADYTGTTMLNDFNPAINNPTVNINAGSSGLTGSLAFDTGSFSLILTVIRPGTVFRFK